MSDNIFMKKFSEDEIIIHEGKNYDEMYKIVSGRAALYLQYGTENEYLIGVLSDGKCFGEVSVLTGKPSPYSVVAVSDIMVMRIGADRFESFISQNPRNTAEIMKNMANSIVMLKANVGMMSEELKEILHTLEKDKEGKALAEDIRMKLARYNLSGFSESSIFSEKA
ncbi:MAG: Crp/Fnr family transcriptional regulator [Huintestinicola sp.]